MDLKDVARLRIGKFEFILKPRILLHTHEVDATREAGKELEYTLSKALQVAFTQPEGYGGLGWQDYLERILGVPVIIIIEEPKFCANEIDPALQQYSFAEFNLAKGELQVEPEVLVERLIFPPLEVGEVRVLNQPFPGESSKFIVKGIKSYHPTLKAPFGYSLVEVLLEDGDIREFAHEFVYKETHRL